MKTEKEIIEICNILCVIGNLLYKNYQKLEEYDIDGNMTQKDYDNIYKIIEKLKLEENRLLYLLMSDERNILLAIKEIKFKSSLNIDTDEFFLCPVFVMNEEFNKDEYTMIRLRILNHLNNLLYIKNISSDDIRYSALLNKYFLDIVDEHIKETYEAEDFEEYRRFYNNLRYAYAFIFGNHDSENNKINDFPPTLVARKISNTTANIMCDLDIYDDEKTMALADYLRSLSLLFSDMSFERMVESIRSVVLSEGMMDTGNYMVLNNIFDFRDEDIEKFDNSNNFKLKRRF